MATSGFTRREFTLAMASGAALAADQSSSAFGQEFQAGDKVTPKTSSPEEKAADKKDAATSKPADDEPREPPPEAAYLLGLIMRRYADERLDEAAVAGIVRDIYGDLARSRVLSSFPLENSDEPAFVFQAWRAE